MGSSRELVNRPVVMRALHYNKRGRIVVLLHLFLTFRVFNELGFKKDRCKGCTNNTHFPRLPVLHEARHRFFPYVRYPEADQSVVQKDGAAHADRAGQTGIADI